MLADHAARIATRGARLGAETWRVRHELQRQRTRLDDLFPHQVGQGHLGGWDQIKALLAAHSEQVLLEFRQLTGADQGMGGDQIGRIDLGIAVLLRVQVEHELRECALQTRQGPSDHRKACTGDASGGLEVQLSECFADRHVVARLEREMARLAVAADFDIRRLIPARGHSDLMRPAASKSSCPSASPIATWSRGSNAKWRGSPWRLTSTFAVSSLPEGTPI